MSKGFQMPGNMQAILKQAQKMQEDLMRAQEESRLVTAEASAGGGMVRALVNGGNQLVSITISKEVVNPEDIEMLQDLVVAAVNEAMEKVGNATKEKMKKVTGGLNIPGL